MSSADFTASSNGLLAAWESEKQVYFGRVENGSVAKPMAAPGAAKNRKYPVVSTNAKGETLFAWTEGTAWKKGGTVEWQAFDKDGRALADKGITPGFPAFSLIAAFTRPDGSFVVVY
jgi:hypothetical protein